MSEKSAHKRKKYKIKTKKQLNRESSIKISEYD